MPSVLLAYAPCIVFLISISLDSVVLMLRNLLPGDPEVLVSRESGLRMIFCWGRMFQIDLCWPQVCVYQHFISL